MRTKRLYRVGVVGVAVMLVLALGVLPAAAEVAGDIAAGLPLEQVITNAQAAGLTMDAIISQAVDAGANPQALFSAAVATGADLSQVFSAFMAKAATNPDLAAVATPAAMMNWAKDAGKDSLTVANSMMAAGGDLNVVRSFLSSVGYAGADTYTYTPPGPPPGPPVAGPTFPGGGGGGGGGGAPTVGGGVASPSI